MKRNIVGGRGKGEEERKTNKIVAGVNEREKKSIHARNWNDRAVGLAMATADNKLSDDGQSFDQ